MTAIHAPAVELLAAILAGQPRLDGAACLDHIALFDRAADGDREAAEEATEVCARCPVVETCRAWIAHAYPKRSPPGVWAGTYQPPTLTRKKAVTT